MKYIDGVSRQQLKESKWYCVTLDMIRVLEARKTDTYFEWFEDKSDKRYRIFSVPDALEYWFEDGHKATEFALRWS